MGVVTVTGNAWTAAGVSIPADRRPQLLVEPEDAAVADGNLIADVEVFANLNTSTGAFTVDLVAAPQLRYRLRLRWLSNPNEQDPTNWAMSELSWPFSFNPYPLGGNLDDLVDLPDLTAYTVLVSLDPPPPGYRGWYLNAPGPGFYPGDPDDPASSGTGILEMVV